MISGDDIRGAQISAHRFKEGYDVDEVDELLDAAADTIDYLQRTHVHMHMHKPLSPLANLRLWFCRRVTSSHRISARASRRAFKTRVHN